MRGQPLAQRFWANVERGDGCWNWTAKGHQFGYGELWDKRTRRAIRVHRLSWELHNGPVPTGMHVCHHCDNPKCVRPDHLFLGSHRDNMRDMRAKGRGAHGPGNVPPWAKANREKTHCPRGHEYNAENTWRDPRRGYRYCKACWRMKTA